MAQLWVQEKVRNGDIVLEKVDGKVNLSACLTKYASRDDIQWQMSQTGQTVRGGRHNLCPEKSGRKRAIKKKEDP